MVLCAGQALIDCIVTMSGSESVADDIALAAGGEAFNEASVLAALGDKTLMLGAVGTDQAGMLLNMTASLRGFDIINGGYHGRTAVSLLEVDSLGGRKSRVSRVHDLTGFKALIPDGVKPDFVTMGSLFRPPFLSATDSLEFVQAAKELGAVIVADTKLPKGTDPRLADYAALLPMIDYIVPNEAEAYHYTGKDTPEEAAAVLKETGVKNVIVKLAERGSYVLPETGAAYCQPSFKVDVVDGIGAGDAYIAGLIHMLGRGASLKDVVRFASACGAVSTTKRGASAAIRNAAQIDEFLAGQSA